MAKKVRPGGTLDEHGRVTHWWGALANVPAAAEGEAYTRLRTLWGDQTRKRTLRGDPYQEFLAPRTETNLTATLWENFALFPAALWLPELLRLSEAESPLGQVTECRWSYGWSIGERPNKILDVVIHARTADGKDHVVVVEAKRPGNAPKGKDLELPYYLDVTKLRDVAEDRRLLFCVDEAQEDRLRTQLQRQEDRRWLLTTWQQVAGLQVRLARTLALPEPVRNFVAGAIQYQWCQHDIRPATLSAPYLAVEPSGEDSITKRAGDGLKQFPPDAMHWRLPDRERRADRNGTGKEALTRESIVAILRFLPVFDRRGFTFGDYVSTPGQFGHVAMAPEVSAFHQALYDHGWVADLDWPSFQDEACAYIEDPARLDDADLETIRKLFTLHARKDRFCEGHLVEMLEEGHIQAILRRLYRMEI